MIDKKELIKLLTKDGACMPAVLASREMGVPELLKLYTTNIDHCITSDLLTADFLNMHATDQQLMDAGIYTHYHGTIKSGEMLVLINCTARIMVSGYHVTRIYARNSHITLDVVDYGYAMVDLHDRSRAVVHNRSSNACQVNQHLGATVENVGHVKINKKDT